MPSISFLAGKAFDFLTNVLPASNAQVTAKRILDKKKAEIQTQVSKLPKSAKQQQISRDVQAFQTPSAPSVADAGISFARNIARVPETIARSSVQAGFNIAGKINPNIDVPNVSSATPTDPLRRAIYGSEPVQTYQERTAGNKKVVEGSRFRKFATPLSFLSAAATIGGDVINPGGNAAKKGTVEGIQKLVKASTEQEVRAIMKGTPQTVIDKVAPAIAKTKDPHIIDNIIQKAYQPSAMVPPVPQRGTYQPPDFFKAEEEARRQEPLTPLDELDITKLIDDAPSATFSSESKSRIKQELNDSSVKEITIYRATDAPTLNPGDYVALDRKHADQYINRGTDARIIETKIPKNHLQFNTRAGDFVYAPDGYTQGRSAKIQSSSPTAIPASVPRISAPAVSIGPSQRPIPSPQDRAFALIEGDFEGAGYRNHHGIWVDNAISDEFANRITPETATKLKAQGITTIEKAPTKTGIEYANRRIGSENHGVIKISDENNFRHTTTLDPQLYHESGHHIWSQNMTPEDKATFSRLNPEKTASHMGHEHAGRVGGEMDSESFSDYVAMELQGKGDQIPKEVRPIVQKYTKSPSPAAIPPAAVSAPVSDILPTPPAGQGTTLPQRSFLQTTQKADVLSPETKQAISEVNPQTYTPTNNPELLARAQNIVNTDYPGAVERLKTTERVSDEDVAVGQVLMQKAQEAGRIGEAVDIAEHLDNTLRESGRAIQAASIIGRLTPEGVLKLATRKITKARNSVDSDKLIQEKPIAGDIKKAIESFDPQDKQVVEGGIQKAVQESSKPRLPRTSAQTSIAKKKVEDLTTGQKIAKKVEREVAPPIKKKADLLVDEITKKIKRELLPERKTAKRSAVEVLREVFGRNKEAQEAFPEAQRILREKFKDNPRALEILDKFFKSELGLPVASKTIDNALRDQLSKSSVQVSKAIYESWANQKQTVEDITQALVSEGFDKESAAILGKEIHQRLSNQFAEAKTRTLQRLAKDVPKKARATFTDKINKLSNIGALGDRDYTELARAKLGLPNLTSENAAEISKLSQQLQGMPDSYEKFQVMKQIQEKIDAAIPQTTADKLKDVLAASKSSLASYDISGGGRQGAVLGSRFPKVFAQAEKKSLSYLKSEETYDRAMADHALSPNKDIYDSWGLDLATPGGITEEAYRSSLPEKIPVFGKGVSASNRAYTGVLTDIRAGAADQIIQHYKDIGVDVRDWPQSWKESMGKFINTASGRGSGKPGGLFEKYAPFLNDTLFSPKLWKSRLDMLNPVYYAKLKGPARKYALQSASSFAGVASVILGLAALAGADVETDPRSSDFLKIKVGDTRYDILGGFQQNLVFAARELTGQKKNSTTGNITSLTEGGFGMANRISILADLIENKSNPVFGFAKTQILGTDKSGNKLTVKDRLAQLPAAALPLNIQDTYSALKDTGSIPKSILQATIPGSIGVGVNTYGIKDLKPTARQQAYIDQLKQRGAPKEQLEATKLFYSTLKAKPDRQKASDDINQALAARDIDKAVKLSKAYNKKYAASFKDWIAKYEKYGDDKQLVKDYNAGKIILTSTSVKQRMRSIETNPLFQATYGGQQ